jgi:DNA-binding transcriptional MocR family regulator
MWAPDLNRLTGSAYRRLADAIATDIYAGRLKPGEQLPTQRDLARRMRLALGTVTRAYAEAARRGLIACEVGRGTFVRREPEQGEIPTPLRRRPIPADPFSAPIIELSMNTPVTVGDAERAALVETLARISKRHDLSVLLRNHDEHITWPQREVAAGWLGQLGLAAAAERVFPCAGAQHALTAATSALLRPGELLLTEALTYPGMKARAEMQGLRLRGLPMDEFGLLPDAFDAACREDRPRALYVIPTLQVPTAALMPAARRQEIAALAEKHDVIIIEDDDDSFMLRNSLPPIASMAPHRTLFVADTSKAIAPGLRLAYLLAPPALADRIDRSVRGTVWHVSPLITELAARWIEDGTFREMRRRRRAEVAARQASARRILGGARVRTNAQAHHLWMELPSPWRAEAFVEAAAKCDVRIASPEPFVVGRKPAPHAVGVCLGPPRERAELENGLSVLARLMNEGPKTPRDAYGR